MTIRPEFYAAAIMESGPGNLINNYFFLNQGFSLFPVSYHSIGQILFTFIGIININELIRLKLRMHCNPEKPTFPDMDNFTCFSSEARESRVCASVRRRAPHGSPSSAHLLGHATGRPLTSCERSPR